MSAGAILGGASIGAGVGLSSVALMPFNAANTFLGSAFFGYGMILGERYMYQADWPKIQARLEHGEKIENIIQEYTGVFTAVVMKEAKIIFDSVTSEFARIMREVAGFQTVQEPAPPPPVSTPPVPPPIIGGVSQPPVEVPQVIVHPINKPQNAIYKRNLNGNAYGRVAYRNALNLPGSGSVLQSNLRRGTRLGQWNTVTTKNVRTELLIMAHGAWPSPAYFRIGKDRMDYWCLDLSRL